MMTFSYMELWSFKVVKLDACRIVMKGQLVILLILVSSLLATIADQQCVNLLQQCNQFKTKCDPILENQS